jgi:hypothetical protein
MNIVDRRPYRHALRQREPATPRTAQQRAIHDANVTWKASNTDTKIKNCKVHSRTDAPHLTSAIFSCKALNDIRHTGAAFSRCFRTQAPPRARRCRMSAGTSGYVSSSNLATARRTAAHASAEASGMVSPAMSTSAIAARLRGGASPSAAIRPRTKPRAACLLSTKGVGGCRPRHQKATPDGDRALLHVDPHKCWLPWPTNRPFARLVYPFTRLVYPFARLVYPFARLVYPFARLLYPFARLVYPFSCKWSDQNLKPFT